MSEVARRPLPLPVVGASHELFSYANVGLAMGPALKQDWKGGAEGRNDPGSPGHHPLQPQGTRCPLMASVDTDVHAGTALINMM